ncbi:hypothetical protein RLIN73S_01487 [Rhodanobacter lindaniclasticus]
MESATRDGSSMPDKLARYFGRQLAALLDQLFEQRNQRARNHVQFTLLRVVGRLDEARARGQHAVVFLEVLDRDTRLPLDQHLDRAIGQFQQLQHTSQRADLVQIGDLGVVDVRAGLGYQQDLPFAFHRAFQRPHRLVAADEQRDHHVRIDHHVAQGQYRKGVQRNGGGGLLGHGKAIPRNSIGVSSRHCTGPLDTSSGGGPATVQGLRRSGKRRGPGEITGAANWYWRIGQAAASPPSPATRCCRLPR